MIQDIKVCRNAPIVSHLVFADDSLIFLKANREMGKEFKQILDDHEHALGQKINLDKSVIMFSPNCNWGGERGYYENLEHPGHCL